MIPQLEPSGSRLSSTSCGVTNFEDVMNVRTRFAPSPSGYLHLGNIRSAIMPWAFARHHNGKFVLRIDDTDTERSTPEATKAIFEMLDWLGLDYDEGPIYQSERKDYYRASIDYLLAHDLAYHCYMTSPELETLRNAQIARGETPRYDNTWRPEPGKRLPKIPPGINPVVRFKNPLSGKVRWTDLVKGDVEFDNKELDDFVICRFTGEPMYNFCSVMDDLDLNITHVIRGDDHVNNTPRQINLIHALKGDLPIYAHLPTVLTADGQKLAKRHGAKGVVEYMNDGYLPDAIINYAARLGWSHGDEEIFDRDQFVAWFDLKNVNPAAARVDAAKLDWVAGEHMKLLTPKELGDKLRAYLIDLGCEIDKGPDPTKVADLYHTRHVTLADMASASKYLYVRPPKAYVYGETKEALLDILQAFKEVNWDRDTLGALIKKTAADRKMKMATLFLALHEIMAGHSTPPLSAVLELLGRNEAIARLLTAVDDPPPQKHTAAGLPAPHRWAGEANEYAEMMGHC